MKSSIIEKIVDVPETAKFALKYFITHHESAYGIEVEKYFLTDRGEQFAESEIVDGITDKYAEIELLTKKLAGNFVTPTTLVAVVDDFISEIS